MTDNQEYHLTKLQELIRDTYDMEVPEQLQIIISRMRAHLMCVFYNLTAEMADDIVSNVDRYVHKTAKPKTQLRIQ